MMTNNWLTQKQDMQAAMAIVNKHIDFNDGKPLSILYMEVTQPKVTRKSLEVKIQSWVLELLDYFREQYGWREGNSVTGKVITRLLLQGETIH